MLPPFFAAPVQRIAMRCKCLRPLCTRKMFLRKVPNVFAVLIGRYNGVKGSSY